MRQGDFRVKELRTGVCHAFVRLGAPLIWSETKEMVCYKFSLGEDAVVPVFDILASIKRVCDSSGRNAPETVSVKIESGDRPTITVIVRNKQTQLICSKGPEEQAPVKQDDQTVASRLKRGIADVVESARVAIRNVSRKVSKASGAEDVTPENAVLADLNYYRPLGLDPASVETVVGITRRIREAIESNLEDEVFLSQSVTLGLQDAKQKDIYIDTRGVPVLGFDDFVSIRRHVDQVPTAPAALTYQYVSQGGGAIRVVASFKIGPA